jgi:hypothetical protein
VPETPRRPTPTSVPVPPVVTSLSSARGGVQVPLPVVTSPSCCYLSARAGVQVPLPVVTSLSCCYLSARAGVQVPLPPPVLRCKPAVQRVLSLLNNMSVLRCGAFSMERYGKPLTSDADGFQPAHRPALMDWLPYAFRTVSKRSCLPCRVVLMLLVSFRGTCTFRGTSKTQPLRLNDACESRCPWLCIVWAYH